MGIKNGKTQVLIVVDAGIFCLLYNTVSQKKEERKIRLGTVFSGIGAIEQAMKRLGINHEIIFACDNGNITIDVDYEKELKKIKSLKTVREKIDYEKKLYNENSVKKNFVEQSYQANYNVQNYFYDVKLFDGNDFKGKVDLFVGGSPCQSFSIIGSKGGFEDTRGTLFYEYVRLIKEIQPKVFVFENVYGLYKHDKGKTWETIKNVFGELGYHFDFKILDARNFGIPQGRRRLFVVGFKNKKDFEKFEFPIEQPLTYKMQDFLEDEEVDGGLLSVNGVLEKTIKKQGIPEERYYLSDKLKKYVLSAGTKNFYHPEAGTDLNIARALLSTMGNSHRASVNNYVTTNGRLRALTMREVHRLMGFPDDYKIVVSKAQAYKQAGNSIVVDVLMALLKNILKAVG